MKLAANRKNLKRFAKDLFRGNYTPEAEKALIQECLTGFVRDEYYRHISHDRAEHVARIDKILGNCGVEGCLLDKCGNDVSGECSDRNVHLDLEYSNTGDMYALTIGYVNGKLRIFDFGSLL